MAGRAKLPGPWSVTSVALVLTLDLSQEVAAVAGWQGVGALSLVGSGCPYWVPQTPERYSEEAACSSELCPALLSHSGQDSRSLAKP